MNSNEQDDKAGSQELNALFFEAAEYGVMEIVLVDSPSGTTLEFINGLEKLEKRSITHKSYTNMLSRLRSMAAPIRRTGLTHRGAFAVALGGRNRVMEYAVVFEVEEHRDSEITRIALKGVTH